MCEFHNGALDTGMFSPGLVQAVNQVDRGRGVGSQLMARYDALCLRRGITTILALVYDWNRDMHRVMRRKHYRNSGRLVEYIQKLVP